MSRIEIWAILAIAIIFGISLTALYFKYFSDKKRKDKEIKKITQRLNGVENFITENKARITNDKKGLERTPKYIIKRTYLTGECPNCGGSIINSDQVCRICGQKLNWEDSNDL